MKTAAKPFSWGANPLAADQWHCLHELWLYVSRNEHEFTLGHCYGEQNAHPRWLQFSALRELRFPCDPVEMEARPRLATRPVVARPNVPVFLPMGEDITLYVGTSLWLCLEHAGKSLLDLPVARLSDSWFGPNTRRGELCFACGTHARLSMEGVRANPWKAITPVTIRNRSEENLTLDRINLPVPSLKLYRGEDRYWTAGVTITRGRPGSPGELEISGGAPKECPSPTEVSDARQPGAHGVWHKAVDLILG